MKEVVDTSDNLRVVRNFGDRDVDVHARRGVNATACELHNFQRLWDNAAEILHPVKNARLYFDRSRSHPSERAVFEPEAGISFNRKIRGNVAVVISSGDGG